MSTGAQLEQVSKKNPLVADSVGMAVAHNSQRPTSKQRAERGGEGSTELHFRPSLSPGGLIQHSIALALPKIRART